MTCLALDLGLLEIKINSGIVGNSLDSFYFIGIIVQKAKISSTILLNVTCRNVTFRLFQIRTARKCCPPRSPSPLSGR